MASLGDYISLLIFLGLVVGTIYLVYFGQAKVSDSVAGVKQNLKDRGVSIDANGVSVKTDKRNFNSEEYVTKTSQAVLNSGKRAMDSGAFSFGAADKRKGKK